MSLCLLNPVLIDLAPNFLALTPRRPHPRVRPEEMIFGRVIHDTLIVHVHNWHHALYESIHTQSKFFPNFIEELIRGFDEGPSVRLVYLHPPGVESGEFPVDKCDDLAVVYEDVGQVEVAVGEDVGCSLWKVFLPKRVS